MNFTNLKLAWRNIWRNKLRSSIVILAVTVGLFGGLAASGIMKGMVLDMVSNSLETQVSNVQVHNKDFMANNEVAYIIEDSPDVVAKIRQDKSVKAVCERTKSFGMATTASKGVGVMINGIEPEKERMVTEIHNKIGEGKGSYFTSDRKNRILISEKLAKKLNVKLKSKIVITFQDFEGNLTGSSFKVEGIFKTQNSMFDELNVFVKKKDIDRLLNLPENSSHEIAVLLNDYKETPQAVEKIGKMLPSYLVEGWYDIDPYLKLTSSMTDYMLFIFMSIIMLALGFAIVNTMLMVILERTKELGMIMAIGMNRFKVFKMIMYETTMLAIVGGVLGILVSVLFTSHFGRVGIDISSVAKGFESLGYSSVMHPVLEFIDYVEVIIMVMLTGIIASIFPTIRALKMKPVEAIRD
ncbi:MAG: ABC transporter permease [Chlorobi bacterium]|nr:ABC transporter permease [Chlorobiota bacterium]